MRNSDKRKLTNENIEKSLTDVRKSLKEEKLSEKEITRYALMIEEILLKYQKHAGSDVLFEVMIRKIFRHLQIRVQVYSAPFDYREAGDSETEMILSRLTSVLRSSPAWSYRKDCNVVSIVAERKKTIPMLLQVLAAAVLAFLTYPLLGLLPDSATETMAHTIAPELTSIMNGMLRMIAGLLIYFSVTASIVHMGDIGTLKKNLRRILSRIFLNDAFLIVCGLSVLLLFCGIDSTGKSVGIRFDDLFVLFTDMVPTEFFSAFISGNMIQITLLGIFTGCLILMLKQSMGTLLVLLEEMQQLFQMAMKVFTGAIPLLVYLNLLSLTRSAKEAQLGTILLSIAAVVILCLLLGAAATVEFCILHKWKIGKLIKGILPASIYAFSTSSEAAALSLMKKDMKDLGVEESFADFAVPMEQVFYKPYVPVTLAGGLLAVYLSYDLQLTIGSVVILGILSFVIALATPSVPGGMVSVLTILTSQMAMPDGALGLFILIYMLTNNVITGYAIFTMQIEMVGLACRGNQPPTAP